MYLKIQLIAKNKLFINFIKNKLIQKLKSKKFNLAFFIKVFVKKYKKLHVSLLKSPHVNKKAQEQFESRTYTLQLNIFSKKFKKILKFFKKIKTTTFVNLNIITTIFLKKNTAQNNFLNPNNINFNFKKFYKRPLYFKYLDLFGELKKFG